MSSIQKFLHFYFYHEYFIDLILSKLYLFYQKKINKLNIGYSTRLRGLPIFSIIKGSYLSIGDNSYLISRSRNTALGVNHPVIIRTLGINASLSIGNNFSASGVTICCVNNIQIGNRVMLGANVTIIDTDFHSILPELRFSECDLVHAKSAPIVIEDDVFIGMNAIILKGVTIGCGSVISAGAIVTKDIEKSTIVGGNPATIIKKI